ncbi:dihydrofolate reductase family protein [Paraburkholderia sp. SIMBA_030]|uniref:dihydrofolate reductase family protein n=1 Tax=Paraburkholderia sp. SIMBA_030 TaxID=3085773 RepID=UPI003978ED87
MRPKIICHMVASIDGRLLPPRWTPPAKGVDRGIVSRIYEEVADSFDADGWIIGRKSMEDFATGEAHDAEQVVALPRTSFIGDRRGRSVAVAVDPGGKLHYTASAVDGQHFITVLSERVSDGYLAELRHKGVSYTFAGEDGSDLEHAMRALGEDFGIRLILLEGGGLINGSFLKAGLIDEMSLLVYPGVDGLASVPSIFEYHGGENERPAAGKSLRHVSTETLEGGMVWIRYAFEASPEAS